MAAVKAGRSPVASVPSPRSARIEAERGLLGAALLAPDVLDELGLAVSPGTWYRPPHEATWTRLVALRALHPTLAAGWYEVAMLAAWDWPDVDGCAYVAGLARDCPSAEAAPYYLRSMRRLALTADCRTAAAGVVEAIDRGDAIDDVIASHRDAMRGLLARGVS